MLIYLFLLIIIVESSLSTTSIKTYPTVNLTENVPINTNVIKLIDNNDKNEIKTLKLILLNLSGYETNLFEIKNENIYTINEIDREQFIGDKRCFDRLFCLIEIHILVNDGQQYWVIPIHIIDENDNKPQFKSLSINLTISEPIFDGYKIPFEGAIDNDEGKNSEIYYILDCSIKKKRREEINEINEKLINCSPLFNLIIFSQLLINQNDQLGIEINPSYLLSNEYSFILYAFNLNEKKKKELINSMIINIYIQQILQKPKFNLSKYEFIIKDPFLFNKEKYFIGKIKAKSNDLNKKLIYKIINQTNNEIELNSLTGDLFLLNNNLKLKNEINLIIESSYLINQNLKTLINIKIFIRLLNKLKQISFKYQFNSFFIQQLNNSNQFLIKKQNFSLNFILFNLTINSFYYPFDQFYLSLLNSNSLFSLLPSSNKNDYSLKINNSFPLNSNYFLIIQIKHQLTNEYISNLTLQFISNNSSSSSSTKLCLENSTYYLYHLNQTNFIGKLEVMETNLNVVSFSTFILSKLNKNTIMIIDQCRMMINDDFNSNLNHSNYQLCSLSNECYNISLIHYQSHQMFFLKRLLRIRPIEITILSVSFVFILATISLILIICRLKGFHLCLSIKNYLFYGKKYGLNQAQRLSSNKITERVHSIVVRESRSPSSEYIKSIEPYIYNINQYIEQERIPSIHFYGECSSQVPTSLSCTSSLEREERTIDHERIPQTSSSSLLVAQETKQLIEMLTSNEDLDVSRLASEV